MCLITSQFKAYTLTEEITADTPTEGITAYKLVKKVTDKKDIYYSPFQGAVYDFNSKSSPIELSTGKKEEEITSTNHGNKNSLGGRVASCFT